MHYAFLVPTTIKMFGLFISLYYEGNKNTSFALSHTHVHSFFGKSPKNSVNWFLVNFLFDPNVFPAK